MQLIVLKLINFQTKFMRKVIKIINKFKLEIVFNQLNTYI
jgi:hypothetical protein